MGADAAAVRDAMEALARSFKRVSVYRHARDQHAGYLDSALSALRSLLDLAPTVTLAVEPTALLFEGEIVHAEPARETGLCFRLHRDGVRSLVFRRGLGLEELVSLAYVAMADPQADGGREDAVTELWKADLGHIGYTAGAGYRMDELAGDSMHSTLIEIAARAQDALERHVGVSFAEAATQPLLWDEPQRKKRDPDDYAGLSRRAALTILRIVEQDYAGWDLDALQESFWRLVDQMIARQQSQILAQALAKLCKLGGSHAGEFRQAVGRWLSDPARIERVVSIAVGSERPPLLPPWLQLLPQEVGPSLVAVIGAGRDPAARHHLAAAALARFSSCAQQLDQLLRKGGVGEVQAVLSALPAVPPAQRAELAEAAFANPDPILMVEAVPLLAAEPSIAIRALGPALAAPARAVRVAAAHALANCGGMEEQASSLLLAQMAKPQFARVDKEERTIFYRALGKLGSSTGFSFLLERLARPQRKFFRRRKGIEEQLLAVQGLAEEGSQRSLRALEEALIPARGHPPAVVAACRAAAQHVRERPRGGKA